MLGGVGWGGVVWWGVVWCGVVWCGVVWCGVVWCGVVWCGVVWCGVVQNTDHAYAYLAQIQKDSKRAATSQRRLLGQNSWI